MKRKPLAFLEITVNSRMIPGSNSAVDQNALDASVSSMDARRRFATPTAMGMDMRTFRAMAGAIFASMAANVQAARRLRVQSMNECGEIVDLVSSNTTGSQERAHSTILRMRASKSVAGAARIVPRSRTTAMNAASIVTPIASMGTDATPVMIVQTRTRTNTIPMRIGERIPIVPVDN